MQKFKPLKVLKHSLNNSGESKPPRVERVERVEVTPKATIGNATVFEGPASMLTSQISYSANQPRGRSLTNTLNQRISYHAPIEDSPKRESDQVSRINQSTLRRSGKMIMDTNTTKRKTKKALRDFS
jgi:hypothetical protein